MTPSALSLRSRAPTRIDLCGGTVDLWPIFLLLENAATINLGIDLFAEAKLDYDPSGADIITLESADQGQHLALKWSDLEKVEFPPALALHGKLLRHFYRRELQGNAKGKMRISTQAKSPAGAGLGGSSTLSVALIGALSTWARGSLDVAKDGERFVEITRDVETTVIRVPAGIQDYYGAMFGNLQAWHWQPGSHRRELFGEEAFQGIEDRTLLFYSGQSRNSGINNWVLFKAFIDRDPAVQEKFREIVAATHDLSAALKARNWNQVAAAIQREWKSRRGLAPGITTPAIDQALELAQKEFGGVGKICGAGGGGCFFVYLPDADPDRKKRFIDSLHQKIGPEIRHLSYKAVPHGVEVDRF